jgi:hypothetical protein
MSNEGYYQFIDRAKEFACGIYKNIPGALVPKTTDAGYKLIWDDLCAGEAPLPGLPPPPVSPFEGGQCACSLYQIHVEIYNFAVGGRWDALSPQDIYGPITAVSLEFDPMDGDVVYASCRGYAVEGCIEPTRRRLYRTGNPSQSFYNQVRVTRIVLRGGSNNCGNPPKAFPSAPPPPPNGYNSPPTTIINNDGDEYKFIFNLQPPTIQKFPEDPLPPITINVSGDDNDLSFDIDFNFGGEVSINKPGEGGGNLPSNFKYEFQNLGTGLGGVGAGVANLEKEIYFENFPPPFIDSPEVEKEEDDVTDGGKEEDGKDGLLGVLVELTKPPTDVQFGTPNVNYAGWFTFLVQGGYTPRNPINFEKGYFEAPPGATGYALTFTKGAEGKVTVYSRKED